MADLLRSTAPFTEAGLTAHVLTGVLPIAKLIEIKVHGPVYHRDFVSFRAGPIRSSFRRSGEDRP
ncbi:MAG: hypothetical protein M0C28_02915 [Candidatus Moduliflexus flocculans]|nr:hypothetical protein [Candidatus Moduliflexus flocculans]